MSSETKELDIFRNEPRKSRRIPYRLMKIRLLYDLDHTVGDYPSDSRRCVHVASLLSLLHGFNLSSSVREQSLAYLYVEWMASMK